MQIPTKAAALTAAVVIIAAGTFGAFRYASAQEGTSTPSTAAGNATPGANATKRRQAVDAFVGKVATNLNISPDQLKAALKDAGLQTVDELVANGKLTAEQGTKLKDAINSGKYPELARLFRHRTAAAARIRRGLVVSAAGALNIAPKDLATELKAGKSIADVATEHNVSLDAVKTQITTDAKTRLDTAVQNKTITQERADAAMAKLTANLDKILNHHRGDTPVASATPGA